MTLPDYTNGPTYYPQGDWFGYVVYLDFGQLAVSAVGLPTAQEVFQVWQIVATALQPVGLTVTTRYPRKLRPGEFTRVVFDPESTIGWRDAGGNTPMKQLRNPSWWNPCLVYAGWSAGGRSGWVAAHETVHSVTSIDLNHSDSAVLPDGTPDLMSSNGPAGKLSNAFIADVRKTVTRFKAGERMCPFVTAKGQWTFDWTNIGK